MLAITFAEADMTKRIAIAELEGVALDWAVRSVKYGTYFDPGFIAATLSDAGKREWLRNYNPSGFMEVPDELVEGSDEPVSV